MAVPRLRVPSSPSPGYAGEGAGLSDEVELYHRTYTTLLRSSGETLLRVLEPSHRSMNSSLHPLAATNEVDLGAFLYAMRRLPHDLWKTTVVALGQEASQFRRAGLRPLEGWGGGGRGGGGGASSGAPASARWRKGSRSRRPPAGAGGSTAARAR